MNADSRPTKPIVYGDMRAELRENGSIEVLAQSGTYKRRHTRIVLSPNMLKALAEAYLPKQPSEPEAVSGWVIEGAWSPIDAPDYWVGSSAWSPDAYKALRFATLKDAQQAADMMCSGLSVRLCEHEWAEQPETKVAVQTDEKGRPMTYWGGNPENGGAGK